MSLESANFINQLVATNPDGTDPKGQGDDHLRMIKKVLQNTFPAFTEAVTGTAAQINAACQPGAINLPGFIVMWSGLVADIPSGWLLCNGSGTISTGSTVPDLRDKFIQGAGGLLAPRSVGGKATHTHVVTVAGTTLTIDQIPNHSHGFGWNNTPTQGDQPGVGAALHYTNKDKNDTTRVKATGGGKAHTHTATNAPTSHLPPYYALAFIIKN